MKSKGMQNSDSKRSKMKLGPFALLSFLAWPQLAHANLTGEQPQKFCAAVADTTPADPHAPERSAMCLGHIQGATEGMTLMLGAKAVPEGEKFCLPGRISLGQQLQAIWDFMKAHPEAPSRPAYSVIWQAEVEAYPCK